MDAEIFQYDLKSARRKKRLQKWGKQKQLRDMDAQLRELWNKQRDLGLIELEKPIESGWVRFFVLRPDVARSSEAAFYQRILDKINTKVACRRKDFLKRSSNTKRLTPIEQHTKKLYASDFAKCLFSEKEKALFEYKWIRNPNGVKYRAYVFLEEWRFEFKVRKHWITHKKVHDNVLAQRIDELEKVVQHPAIRGRVNKMYGVRKYKCGSKYDVIGKDIDRSLKEMLLELNLRMP